ncbi:MAG: AEC family transporter [Oscillospiraceae bacterium]|nr:AEC family transporter [Oscillospiraceae bacterium]
MENFIFSLHATLPVFLVILLGWFLQRVGILTAPFCKAGNQYVFQCALPVSLFRSISTMDLYSDFNPLFCLFCFGVTTVMFLGVWGLSALLLRDKTMVGAFSQAAARSSAAILGIAFAVNIYGNAGMVPMMIVAAVPFFNIYAVLILSFSPQVDEDGRPLPPSGEGSAVKRACLNVLKNPIILGILIGIPFALLRVQLPGILTTTLDTVGSTATPVALLVVGASFSGGEALKKWRPAVAATFIKLFLLPALFLPLAAALGFRNSEMVAILIMVGSPTTVSCYVMAKSMRGDGVLTANVIVLATLLSSVSITLWLFLLRSFALI